MMHLLSSDVFFSFSMDLYEVVDYGEGILRALFGIVSNLHPQVNLAVSQLALFLPPVKLGLLMLRHKHTY